MLFRVSQKGMYKHTFNLKYLISGWRYREGEIVKIDIKVGDTIQEDDILFKYQNDKSIEEFLLSKW